MQRQRLAGGDAQLPFDQVEPGDHLGHRMLDLQPRVHLHEVEALAAGLDDELDRAGADIADRARRRDRRLAHAPARSPVEARRRRLLDHLLVAALDRAVALEQVHDVAVRVGEDLDLDVARRARGSVSISTRSSPNARLRLALGAVERARRTRRRSSTMRMPLPPPPAVALISTGKPIRSASASSSAGSWSSP